MIEMRVVPMTDNAEIDRQIGREYEAGFVTDVESETLAPGLNEDTVRFISAKKGEPEWLLEWLSLIHI